MAAPAREIYLAEGFVATSLRVPQLRSILVEHSIKFPSSAKKADLVALFETHVQSRAAEILAADARVRPSARGIIAVNNNGDESPVEHEKEEKKDSPPTGVKRSRARTKKSSATVASDEIDAEVQDAPPPKKPRSRKIAAKPAPEPEPEVEEAEESKVVAVKEKKPRASRRVAQPEIAVDEQDAPAPVEKLPRSRKLKQEVEVQINTPRTPRKSIAPAPAPVAEQQPPVPPTPSARRKSVKPAPPVIHEPSSSSSDAAPPPPSARKPRVSMAPVPPAPRDESKEVKPRRKSRRSSELEETTFSDFNPFQSGTEEAAEAAIERERRRRKSSLGLGESKRRAPRPSEWTATSAPSHSILRRVGPSQEELRSPTSDFRDAMLRDADEAEALNDEVARQVALAEKDQEAEEQPRVVVKRSKARQKVARTAPVPNGSMMAMLLSGLLLLSWGGHWKSISASNGFCDTGSTTNGIIQAREQPIAEAQHCVAMSTQHRSDHPDALALNCDISALPLVPFLPRPTSCTPCPHNAKCENGEVVACAPEYILTPSLLAPLSPLVDGLPGLPSRVFPPACRPDTARMRQIGQMAREIERHLARERGEAVCAGTDKECTRGAGLCFGVSEAGLHEYFASRRNPKMSSDAFDDVFVAALRDLVEHGDVVESIDQQGLSWYASQRAELSLQCRAKVSARDFMHEFRKQIVGVLVVLASIGAFSHHMSEREKEKKRARELVDTVLHRLQDQEYQHYTDPVLTPQPYLPPAQLRDVILPRSEGDDAKRQRLWDRVEREVERNANVATREREVRGDVWKTWEWTGVGGRPRISLAPEAQAISPSPQRAGHIAF